jgi:glucose-6-phosphate isomerase
LLINKDFFLADNGLLSFVEGISYPQPDVRRLQDIGHVLYQAAPMDNSTPLYYMYRNVFRFQDEDSFLTHNIRYDITVLVPGTIGREYIKTVGHFHPLRPQKCDTYPEYYEVLSGEAIYILQKNSRSGEVEEIMAVEAQKGDKVFIPPNYGHITINSGDTPLVMCNLIERNFSSLYDPFKEKRGAAYYYIQGESRKGEFVRNGNYNNSVGLKLVAAPNLSQPVEEVKSKSLYEAFVTSPAAFSILT